MGKRPSTHYRSKRALYGFLVKLNNHISQRFGIPPVGGDADLSEVDPRLTESPPTLLTPLQAARILGVAPKTLANWRVTGTSGLQHIAVGGRIRYRSSDVNNFIIQSAKTSTSDKGGNDHGQ